MHMNRWLIAIAVFAVGVGVVGTAMAVVGDDEDEPNPAAVEPQRSAVDKLVEDPEAGKAPTYASKTPEDKPPTYVPGRAEVVSPASDIARKVNPSQDPNVRICKNPDGTYVVIHTTPVPGKDPYPNDPEDLRSRPC
jgi:hypothetical protein